MTAASLLARPTAVAGWVMSPMMVSTTSPGGASPAPASAPPSASSPSGLSAAGSPPAPSSPSIAPVMVQAGRSAASRVGPISLMQISSAIGCGRSGAQRRDQLEQPLVAHARGRQVLLQGRQRGAEEDLAPAQRLARAGARQAVDVGAIDQHADRLGQPAVGDRAGARDIDAERLAHPARLIGEPLGGAAAGRLG